MNATYFRPDLREVRQRAFLRLKRNLWRDLAYFCNDIANTFQVELSTRAKARRVDTPLEDAPISSQETFEWGVCDYPQG